MNFILNSIFKLAFQILGYDLVFQINPKLAVRDNDDNNNSRKRKLSLRKQLRCKLNHILHHKRSVLVAGMSLYLKQDKQKSKDVQLNKKEGGIELIKIGFDHTDGGINGGTDGSINGGIDDDYVLTTALDYFPYRPSV